MLRRQIEALQRQSAGWAREIESEPHDRQRLQIVGHLVEKGNRVVKELREEAAEGVAPRGEEPAAEGPPTALARRESHAGRAYYRNDIPPPLADYPRLRGPALFDYEIAGCGRRQIELDQLAGGRRDAPVFFRTNALVYAEPQNSNDPHAVAVDIGGWRVGYIRREDAPAFGEELAAAGGPGAFAVRASIENGWPEWRVKLDVERPLRLA